MIDSASRMLVRLERETSEHHALAAADRASVLGARSRAALRGHFAAVYHFECAVETRLSMLETLPISFIARRIKTGHLGDDLLALGLDGEARDVLAQDLVVPELDAAPEALAWIYVLERAALAHATLYRVLLPIFESSYLRVSAETIEDRWRELGIYLDFKGRTVDDERRMIESAHEAFETQHAWFADMSARAWPPRLHAA